jgi:hypothetical protein
LAPTAIEKRKAVDFGVMFGYISHVLFPWNWRRTGPAREAGHFLSGGILAAGCGQRLDELTERRYFNERSAASLAGLELSCRNSGVEACPAETDHTGGFDNGDCEGDIVTHL